MTVTPESLQQLPRDELLAIAHEYMLCGMHTVKSVRPALMILAGTEEDTLTEIGINQWLAASPVYTARLRSLMKIDGHDVPAVMRALQLDVGFVHEYMNVAYQVRDELYGEFRLLHCGALIDIEPFGEERVFSMCHTVEDPTFDATAVATNPRAVIRPIHRPPRTPADKHPHCHWTISIDPDAEPLQQHRLMPVVQALPLAVVANAAEGLAEPDLMSDYSGEFTPGFRLRDLTTATLAAIAREFQLQSNLLAASFHVAAAEFIDDATLRESMNDAWLGAAWVVAERLAKVRGWTADPESLGEALALTPFIPSGLTRSVTVDTDTVRVQIAPSSGAVLSPDQPGWTGSLAAGDTGGFVGTANALGLEVTSISSTRTGEVLTVELEVAASDGPVADPPIVQIHRIGTTTTWDFTPASVRA
jgi:hypothetical protein